MRALVLIALAILSLCNCAIDVDNRNAVGLHGIQESIDSQKRYGYMYLEGSVYHAVESQTDSTPLITASNYHIRNPTNPERIVAVPRTWIQDEVFMYGDTMTVHCDCILQGEWIVQDVMNKRYNYPNDCRVDFLVSPQITGLYDIRILLK